MVGVIFVAFSVSFPFLPQLKLLLHVLAEAHRGGVSLPEGPPTFFYPMVLQLYRSRDGFPHELYPQRIVLCGAWPVLRETLRFRGHRPNYPAGGVPAFLPQDFCCSSILVPMVLEPLLELPQEY